MPAMRAYFLIPLAIAILAGVYWFGSYEPAGSVMLLIFSVAMAVMGWILLPTLNDVGHTAPIDPDFEDPGR
jgi:hypothetical protein